MFSSHSVLGSIDASGTAKVDSYLINSYNPANWGTYTTADRWADALGVVRLAAKPDTTVICFSMEYGGSSGSALQQVRRLPT